MPKESVNNDGSIDNWRSLLIVRIELLRLYKIASVGIDLTTSPVEVGRFRSSPRYTVLCWTVNGL